MVERERGTEFAYDVCIPALVSMENAVAASRHTLLPSRASRRTPEVPSQVKERRAAAHAPHIIRGVTNNEFTGAF